MVAYQHPTELNPLQAYRQASSFLRGTSRATNDSWYKSPLDLEFQIHIRIDGSEIQSWIYQPASGQWSSGPEVTEELLLDPSKVDSFAAEVTNLAKQAGAKAAGLILHVADEFATAEIKPELNNPGALAELSETIITDPKSVLDDSSQDPDEFSWRLIPYPAAGSESIATAVTLSRSSTGFLDAFRNYGQANNFPLMTLAVSAPLVSLLGLPMFKQAADEKSILAVMPYSRFTVLAFFNEHGDLRLLRTLQHRGQRRPSNLRHAAATTAAALEMNSPDIFVLPLSGEPDRQMISDLRLTFKDSKLEECDWSKTPVSGGNPSPVPPEILISVAKIDDYRTPLHASHTFTTLGDENWATQDFLPVAPEAAEVFPSRQEMKLLRAAKYTRLGLAAVAVGSIVWLGFGVLNLVRKPEWTFKASEATAVDTRLAMLSVEQKRISHWDSLLEDRSKGWASMELLSQLFPDNSGFLIKGFTHTSTPEMAPGQTQAGFVKTWKVTGLAQEEAFDRLAQLNNREGISEAFTGIAKTTGNQAFMPDLPTRSVLVSIKTLENPQFKPMPPDQMEMSDEKSYPFNFDLTITQRFESADPMAIIVSKAP